MIIIYEGNSYDCSDEFSFRDLTGRSNIILPNDIIIYASCFSQEVPGSKIFPNDMSGVRFIKCNLDNVFIPVGNAAIDCTQRKFKVQNDLRDWELDQSDVPTRVINEDLWIKNGFSVDPIDIPAEELTSIDQIVRVP